MSEPTKHAETNENLLDLIKSVQTENLCFFFSSDPAVSSHFYLKEKKKKKFD